MENMLQSARGVWRQRAILAFRPCCTSSLQSARGVWRQRSVSSGPRPAWKLQSARGVWRQRLVVERQRRTSCVAICTGRVEAKAAIRLPAPAVRGCNLYGACGGKATASFVPLGSGVLQSARGVWRQRVTVEPQNGQGYGCNLHGACGGKAAVHAVDGRTLRCNLHGACGGKVRRVAAARRAILGLQSARGVWRQSFLALWV